VAPPETSRPNVLTIDELAAATGSTTRTIRSFQTLGILEHPDLKGRTGLYGPHHRQQLLSILQLQARGFSLQSLAVLFAAHRRGESLGSVLGLTSGEQSLPSGIETDADDAELYGFTELQRNRAKGKGRALLAVVPTTVWPETAAS
jgi:DNA-binding transcriptional MerR regulator